MQGLQPFARMKRFLLSVHGQRMNELSVGAFWNARSFIPDRGNCQSKGRRWIGS